MVYARSVADRPHNTTTMQLIWFSLAWGVGLLVVFQVFGDYLPLIFTSDTEVRFVFERARGTNLSGLVDFCFWCRGWIPFCCQWLLAIPLLCEFAVTCYRA